MDRIGFYHIPVVTTYSIILFCAAAIAVSTAGFIAYQARRHPPVPGASTMMVLMAAVAIWSLTEGLIPFSASFDGKIHLAQLGYLGIALVPPLFLTFVMQFSGAAPDWEMPADEARAKSGFFLPRQTAWRFFLWGIPVTTILMVWTNSSHSLHWSRIYPNIHNPDILSHERGPWFWIYTTFAYLQILIGTAFLLRMAFSSQGIFRNQAWLILTAAILPWVGNLDYVLSSSGISLLPTINRGTLSGTDLTPLTFAASGCLLSAAIFRLHLFDLSPIDTPRLLNSLEELIIFIDPSGRITYLNEAAANWIAANQQPPTSQTLIGAHFSLPLKSWPVLVEILQQAIVTTGTVESNAPDKQVICDHNGRWYRWQLTPQRNARGRLAGFLCILTDTTDQHLLEVSLEKQAADLEKVSKISSLIALTLEPQSLLEQTVFLTWQSFGLYHAQIFLLNDNQSELILAAAAGEQASPVLEESEVLSIDLGPSLIAKTARTRQGTLVHNTGAEPDYRPYHLLPDTQSEIAVPILAGDDLLGVLDVQSKVVNGFTVQDLNIQTTLAAQIAVALKNARTFTKLREAQEIAILDTEKINRLATVIDQATDAIFITDLAGDIIYANYQFEVISGYSLEEVMGKNPRFLSSGQQSQDFYRDLWSTILSGGNWKGVFINRRKDGSLYHEATSIFPIKDSQGNITNFAAVKRDITSQVETERELQAFARQERLLNDILEASLRQMDLRKMLQTLADRLGELLEADGCYLTLWDEEHQMTIPYAAYGALRDLYPQIRPQADEPTLTQLVLERREPVAIEDITKSELVSPRIIQLLPSRSLLALPLIAEPVRLGALLISHHEVHHFSPEEISLGNRIARQVSLAIFKTRSEEAARQSENRYRQLAQHLAEINRMGVEVSGALEMEQLLRLVFQRLSSLLPMDRFILGLYNPQARSIIYPALGKSSQLQVAPMAKAPHEQFHTAPAFIQLIITSGRTQYQDLSHESKPSINDSIQAGTYPYFPGTIQEQLGTPLISHGQVNGLLIMQNDDKRGYSSEQIQIFETIASQVAAAIENVLLFEATQRRAQEAETLRQAAATAATTLDLDKTIRLILEELQRVVPYSSAAVHLLHEKENVMEIVGGNGFADPTAVVGLFLPLTQENPLTLVIHTRQPIIEIDVQKKYAEFRKVPHNHIHGWMGVPLMVEDRLIGAISLDSIEESAFNEEQARLVTAFASQVAIALDHARLFQDTQRLAIIDPLTGLFNRRHFFELAQEEFFNCQTARQPISALMIDLDHFKIVNDTFGHQAGDVVLQELAALCHEILRKRDLIGRYGGEEFVILLPETGSEAASQVAERLRSQASQHSINITGLATETKQREPGAYPRSEIAETKVVVTISIGVATVDFAKIEWPASDINILLDRLIDYADQALYQSKNSGRNQVTIWKST